MRSKIIVSLAACIAAFPVLAYAQGTAPHGSGFFAGLDTSVGMAHGSSGTKNAGGFGGGGVVQNITFGTTTGIGVHAGYRFDRHLSGFLSYQHVRGDVDWDAHFPRFAQTSNFSGTATSNAILVNVAYDWLPSDDTAIKATAGVGAVFNTLSGVTERFEGAFASNVEDHTQTNPIAQIGASIQHYITPKTALGLHATVSYVGGFKTGATRTGNLGRTEINPYEIDSVWRTGLGVSLQARF